MNKSLLIACGLIFGMPSMSMAEQHFCPTPKSINEAINGNEKTFDSNGYTWEISDRSSRSLATIHKYTWVFKEENAIKVECNYKARKGADFSITASLEGCKSMQ